VSTSNLYAVYKTKTKEIAEFPNGWGTAPVIYDYLCEKYLNVKKNAWLHQFSSPTPNFKIQYLWDLTKNLSVPASIRLVHAFTYINHVCPSNRILELAQACQEFYDITNDNKRVNHWELIANTLKSFKINKKMIGIALSCSSIQNPWINANGKNADDIFSQIMP